MGARRQGDEWCQSGNRLLPVEPSGPDTIENRNALAEHRQHRRAAGRVDAGGERTVEIFEPPRVELLLEAMKSREKPRSSRPAPRFQPQKPRGGTLSLHEKHRARRRLAERHLNRDLSGSGGELLVYWRDRVFEQARGAVPAETGGVRVTSASHWLSGGYRANQLAHLVFDVVGFQYRFADLEPQHHAEPLSKPMHGDFHGALG